MKFSLNDILSLDELFRKNLINSVGGFKSANLIGTIDGAGAKRAKSWLPERKRRNNF